MSLICAWVDVFLVSVGKKLGQDDILKASRARVYACYEVLRREAQLYIYRCIKTSNFSI